MHSAHIRILKHAHWDSIFTRGQFSTPPYHPSQNFFQFNSHPSDSDTLRRGTWRRGTKRERDIKTQQSHLDVLLVTTVLVLCVSDLWHADAGAEIGIFWTFFYQENKTFVKTFGVEFSTYKFEIQLPLLIQIYWSNPIKGKNCHVEVKIYFVFTRMSLNLRLNDFRM